MQNVIKDVDSAFVYIIVFSLALLVLVTGVMIHFLFRYRKSGNPEPSDIRGNTTLQLVWTLIPTLIALTMFYLGRESFLGLRCVPRDAAEIERSEAQLPNMKSHVRFYAGKTGTHKILCSQYSGVGHADMMADLRIAPENEYPDRLNKK